jgi:hypothetical protein
VRRLLSLASLLRGEGGEPSKRSEDGEPGEGLSQITHKPLTRLGPSVLGTLSPQERGEGKALPAWRARHALRIVQSSPRSCVGSAIALIAAILPSAIVRRSMMRSRPPMITARPTAPSTSAGLAA